MSFYTSLSGLRAAQTDMSAISHNLANVSTNGFKKSRAEFADVIASSVTTSPNQMIGSGAVTKGIVQQFGQGTLRQTGSSLDLAIDGDGFFMVKPELGGAKVNFTRNGGFSVDGDRYVTNAQGAHLQVFPVDSDGNLVASGIDQAISLRIPQTSGAPVPTSSVTLGLNLNSSSAVPANSFDRFDATTYNQSTQTIVYDNSGNAQTLTNYFVKTGDSSWDVRSFVGESELSADPANPAPVQLTFDASGALTSPTAPVAFGAFTPAGSTDSQAISLTLDTGTTQLARPFNVFTRDQDGVAVGKFQGVSIDSDGIVIADFSNGDSQKLGKIAMANFSNPGGLRQLGNSNWSASGLSGSPSFGEPGGDGFGSLNTGMLEGSNVDITEELVALIAAQRNFQANAKALDTASQISQTIFNIN